MIALFSALVFAHATETRELVISVHWQPKVQARLIAIKNMAERKKEIARHHLLMDEWARQFIAVLAEQRAGVLHKFKIGPGAYTLSFGSAEQAAKVADTLKDMPPGSEDEDYGVTGTLNFGGYELSGDPVIDNSLPVSFLMTPELWAQVREIADGQARSDEIDRHKARLEEIARAFIASLAGTDLDQTVQIGLGDYNLVFKTPAGAQAVRSGLPGSCAGWLDGTGYRVLASVNQLQSGIK